MLWRSTICRYLWKVYQNHLLQRYILLEEFRIIIDKQQWYERRCIVGRVASRKRRYLAV